MKASDPRRAIAHDLNALGEAERLLCRYPNVGDEERDRLARFLRHGAPIDIGLLSSNPQLWGAAERFKADHPSYFRLGARVYAGWAAAIAALAIALIFIKDIGLN